MSMNSKVTLSGHVLTVDQIVSISERNATVVLDAKAKVKVDKARAYLEKEMDEKVVYGVNTGFGPMANHVISSRQKIELQENLIRSHAVGLGDPLSLVETRAIMVVRLNTLVKGYSGVRWELLERLLLYINKDILPVIPKHGAVGTSGDLVQLAHIALAIIGEGDVFYKGEMRRTRSVLRELKIKPFFLQAKEGLSLINGTSAMAGIGALLCVKAKRLYTLSVSAGAMGLELVNGFSDEIGERLHRLRPHPGQMKVHQDLYKLLKGSKLMRARKQFQKTISMDNMDVKEINGAVQDVYSFRCIPQIVGPVYDTVTNTIAVVEKEINSVTDNPIVDVSHKQFLHGGNFHGDYVSFEMDKLKIALTKLAILSERRVNFFLNHNVNGFLPPFLNMKKVGLNLGLQALQFVATSTTAECQTLCFPQYIHSIPTNADNQDVVSMGTNAALIASQVVDNVFEVFTIEYIVIVQAIDVLRIKSKLSLHSRSLYNQIRRHLGTILHDRDLTLQLSRVSEYITQDCETHVRF